MHPQQIKIISIIIIIIIIIIVIVILRPYITKNPKTLLKLITPHPTENLKFISILSQHQPTSTTVTYHQMFVGIDVAETKPGEHSVAVCTDAVQRGVVVTLEMSVL